MQNEEKRAKRKVALIAALVATVVTALADLVGIPDQVVAVVQAAAGVL